MAKRLKKENNQSHRKFAEHYAEHSNATMAYLYAHPSVTYNTASTMGCTLLKDPIIQELIKQYREELAIKSNISREKIIKDLIEIKEAQKNVNSQASIKAIEVINKMLGFNAADKIEHSGNLPISIIKINEIKKEDNKE